LKPGPLALHIAASIAELTEAPFELTALERVGGGCIHEAWKLEGDSADSTWRFFAKTNAITAAPMLAAEAQGLRALERAGRIEVPRVMLQADDGERAWLVMDWMELVALDAASGARLGEALAAQHRLPQERFGWEQDNFIGASPQPNGWSDDWLAFWREKRLMAQLRLAAQKRLPSRLIDRGERLAADCGAFFRTYSPAPSLLHGDLWGGNAAALEDGTPVVFDPAVYAGDREADIAMTELFGGFPAEFHSAYRAAWPLHDDYRVRRDFYNAYHLINHANLFAGDYVRQAMDSIERLVSEAG
jgi:fructosamine-3-kinase